MTMKHTPGPWEIDYDTRPAEVCCIHGLPEHGEEKQKFAYVRGAIGYWDADENENMANILLIAAAPDLLAALIALDECYCSAGPDLTKDERHQHRLTLIAARAAVAKATGAA